jgi:hypothetical protein
VQRQRDPQAVVGEDGEIVNTVRRSVREGEAAGGGGGGPGFGIIERPFPFQPVEGS